MSLLVLMHGCGDLGSGIALRLHRSGLHVVIAELEQPLSVRRSVSFSQAVYDNEVIIEGVTAKRVETGQEALDLVGENIIPVIVDPTLNILCEISPDVLIDARMLKTFTPANLNEKPFVIGLGPGFVIGKNCHVVIETNRGPLLGRVFWKGAAEQDTGTPEKVGPYQKERVLRAPVAGKFVASAQIGDVCDEGQLLGMVDDEPVYAPFHGVIRGLLADGVKVSEKMKIGDVDPRLDPRLAALVSDKALAIAGGVLEAILSRSDLRRKLGNPE